jgi:type I site-specific restriction endonuclease
LQGHSRSGYQAVGLQGGNYKTVVQTLKNPEEKAYADYLLLDSSGLALAVIEAKRTDREYVSGLKQAEDYTDDIKKQTGKDVFIFLTNGYETWFYNRPYEAPRAVSGYHDRASLERLRFQNYSKRDFSEVPINKEIIDRPYQVEAVNIRLRTSVNKPIAVCGEVKAKIGTATEHYCKPMSLLMGS